MPDYTHVADKLHGYTLQVRQMMYELISVELERIVSVESLDDVAIQQDGVVIAEQVKSVTSTNNPLGDRSKVFWKTLFNWLNYVKAGSLDIEKSYFRIVVSATYDLEAGSIAHKFAKSSTVNSAEEVLDYAKATIIGDSSIEKTPISLREYVKAVFNESNRANMVKIIAKLEIIIYKDNFDESLFTRFCGQTIPPEYSDRLFIYMLGWVYEETNKSTKRGECPFLSCGSFHDALVQQTRYYNQSAMIPAITTVPNNDVVLAEVARRDLYIMQLDLVQVDFTSKFEAASDFLQTRTEKTEWASRGTVNERSFDNYNSLLKRMWSTEKKLIELSTTENDITRGNKLYMNCLSRSLTFNMEGKEVPCFFGSGSLQALANYFPKPDIGWHPNYEKLLQLEDTGCDEL